MGYIHTMGRPKAYTVKIQRRIHADLWDEFISKVGRVADETKAIETALFHLLKLDEDKLKMVGNECVKWVEEKDDLRRLAAKRQRVGVVNAPSVKRRNLGKASAS